VRLGNSAIAVAVNPIRPLRDDRIVRPAAGGAGVTPIGTEREDNTRSVAEGFRDGADTQHETLMDIQAPVVAVIVVEQTETVIGTNQRQVGTERAQVLIALLKHEVARRRIDERLPTESTDGRITSVGATAQHVQRTLIQPQ